jgi:Protein of unknown function (DUF3095)
MSTPTFYTALPTLDSFWEITNLQNFVPVPTDWLIVVTDIVGSTRAIAKGHYKDVNLLGACSIVAVLNCAADLDLPFVFGGDGAVILIPPTLRSAATSALLATQAIAQEFFNLDLRIGIVPVAEVAIGANRLEIAKLRVSENYSQAVFVGGGLTAATDRVKDPATAQRYQPQGVAQPTANFAGLECRWRDVPSPHGETVSLLVQADCPDSHGLYKKVLEQIRLIYGRETDFHPIALDGLTLGFGHHQLLPETKLRRSAPNGLQTQLYLWKIRLENLLGTFFMRCNLTVGGVAWGRYPTRVTAATDYRKFDDMLRMVISGTTQQRRRLTAYLESHHRAGRLVYGMHVSDRALLTCLVFEREGRQVHFVDGADGGYALAALAMKDRMGADKVTA